MNVSQDGRYVLHAPQQTSVEMALLAQDEGGLGRQGGEGDRVFQDGGFSLRVDHLRVRMVCQHGAHHEGPGPPRQLHDVLHGVQEDDGGEPQALHHGRAEEEGGR